MYYLITYDLHGDNKQYRSIILAIESVADRNCASHILKSAWLIRTPDKSAKDIYDVLKECLDFDDECFVVEIENKCAFKLLNTKPKEVQDLLSGEDLSDYPNRLKANE